MLSCLTIIGIPLGLANFKLIPVSLLPLGREIVSVDQARALGIEPMFAPPWPKLAQQLVGHGECAVGALGSFVACDEFQVVLDGGQ
jgi:hypothetical protein